MAERVKSEGMQTQNKTNELHTDFMGHHQPTHTAAAQQHTLSAGVCAASALCRGFLGPCASTKCVLSHPRAVAADSKTALIDTPTALLHAVDGEPTSTTLLLEALEAQEAAAGSGGTWMVVLAGLLVGKLSEQMHQWSMDGALHPAWLMQGLSQGIAICQQAADKCVLPLTDLAQESQSPPLSVTAAQQQPQLLPPITTAQQQQHQTTSSSGFGGQEGTPLKLHHHHDQQKRQQAQQHRQDAEEKDAFAWFFEDEERGSDDDGSAPTDVVSEAVESECLGVSREGQQQQQQQVGAVDADSEGQQQQQQHIQQSIPLLPPSSVHTLVQQAAHALSHGRDHEMRLSAAALTALITQHAIAIDHHHTDQHMNQQHRPSPNTCSTPSAPLNRPQSSPSQHSLLPIHSMQHSDQHQHQQSDQRTQHAIERSDHHRCVNTGQHMHQQHAHQQMHHIQQRCAAIDCSTHVHVLHLLGPNKHRSRVVHGACIPLGEGVGVQGGRTAAASELCDLLQRRRKSVHHGNGTLSKQQSQHCLEPQDAYQQQQQPQSNTEHSHNTPSPHSTSLSILFLEGGLGIVRPSHTHSNQASPSAHAPATKHIAGKAGTAPKGLKKGFFAVSPAPHTQPRTATSTPTLKSASPAAQASSQAAAAAVPCIDTASVSGRGTASGPVSLVSQPEQLASLIEGQRLEQAAAAVWAALDPLKVDLVLCGGCVDPKLTALLSSPTTASPHVPQPSSFQASHSVNESSRHATDVTQSPAESIQGVRNDSSRRGVLVLSSIPQRLLRVAAAACGAVPAPDLAAVVNNSAASSSSVIATTSTVATITDRHTHSSLCPSIARGVEVSLLMTEGWLAGESGGGSRGLATGDGFAGPAAQGGRLTQSTPLMVLETRSTSSPHHHHNQQQHSHHRQQHPHHHQQQDLTTPPQPHTITPVSILLHAPTHASLASSAAATSNCLNRLRAVLTQGQVLPGGGVYELVCAQRLRDAAAAQQQAAVSVVADSWPVDAQKHCGGPTSEKDGAERRQRRARREPKWKMLNELLVQDGSAAQAAALHSMAACMEDMVALLLQNQGEDYGAVLGHIARANALMQQCPIAGPSQRQRPQGGSSQKQNAAPFDPGQIDAQLSHSDAGHSATLPMHARTPINQAQVLQSLLHSGCEDECLRDRRRVDLHSNQASDARIQPAFVGDDVRARRVALGACESLVRLVLLPDTCFVNHAS